MTSERGTATMAAGTAQPGLSTGMVIAGAVGMLALPSAVLAFTASFATHAALPLPASAAEALVGEGPGMRLARGMSLQSLVPRALYPFTPASNPNRPDRLVTVAVRLDPQAIRAIPAGARNASAGDQPNLRLAQTGFNLGVARGYRNFAPALASASPARRNDPPDLARFVVTPAPAQARAGGSRFSSQVVVDDRAPAGRAPRTFAGDKDEQVDVSGSYRLTRNLNVTAGLRYSQDRERLLPLTDGRQDSQAVYVGTQIRF